MTPGIPARMAVGGRALRLAGVLALLATPLAAQQPRASANWELANKFRSGNAQNPSPLTNAIGSTSVQPNWVGQTDTMWYRWQDRNGARYMLVTPATRQRTPLFDHRKLAMALSEQTRRPQDAARLQLNALNFSKDRRLLQFSVTGDTACFQWNRTGETLARAARLACTDTTTAAGRAAAAALAGGGGRQGGAGGPGGAADFRNFSPDSTHFAFARDHNLFVVNVATRDTIQLTRDGERYFSFGFRDTAQVQQQQQQQEDQQQQQQEEIGTGGQRGTGRDARVRASVTWAPDSRSFFVQRSDSRKVDSLFVINALSNPRPQVEVYKYAMPGEENVPQQELHAWKKGDRTLTKLPIDKWRDQRLFQPHYTTSGDRMRVVRRDRLQRNIELIEVDLQTNAIRTLITESVQDANLEPQTAQIRYVTQTTGPTGTRTGDIIWWSERTGWGHYYLYDHDGKLKNAITSGPWRANSLVSLDSARRVAYVVGLGREAGENPYYQHLYRVGLDGSGLTLMDAGDASHGATAAALSPTRRYYVDNWSRVDQAPRSVLRDENGRIVMELETFDLAGLQEMGWQFPRRFSVKAADGVTDLYGNMFLPFDFDSTKTYPIVTYVYPGPQQEGVTHTFSPTSGQQRLAQLGFVVLQIGNRGGTPERSNAYQSFSYYNMRDYGLADKKVGIEQLAARHSFMDINRVGIYGHSGGGFMTAAALMLPPYNDFFKVGVSSAGNHDNNIYNQNWSEQYHGLREVTVRPPVNGGVAQQGAAGGAAGAAGTAARAVAAGTRVVPVNDSVRYEIRVPTNAELAANLKGKLLLVHGDMDNNVHPGNTIRLVDALIKANKRFDMMIMPGQRHGFGTMQEYFNQMMFEYFAEHLMGDYYRTGADMRGR
jgi:dipeptidyl-peptidase 4